MSLICKIITHLYYSVQLSIVEDVAKRNDREPAASVESEAEVLLFII